ncbi:LCP family protein [Acetobacterium wieringae]|uniref:LCP family protein n=1 Tax=Acetobacterium wieringae TaxID=52694 RepID=UPI0026F1A816|nr:LCP family protein [Acetobacterium wieringae]
MKKKVILVILFLIVSLIGTGLVYGFNTISQINEMVAEPKMDETELAVNNDLDIDTVNIAVFGVDGRSDVDGDRTDTIMIVSMDFRNGNIKVTSIMRDLLVQIPETKDTYESLDKINAAYAYGGPELAIKTINENFDLNIKDYVIVNFDAMVDTVDALGGVEVNVQNEDVLEWTNKYIDDVNDKVGKADPYLETTGVQTITGVQALAYARNRYSDDDFHRTERQREVVKQIASKAFNIDMTTGLSLLSKVYPYIKTTLSISEITTYAKAFLDSPDKQFLEFRLPTDAYATTAMINSVSYVVPVSLVDNVVALHAFIYGPVQSTTTTNTVATSGSSSTTTENTSTESNTASTGNRTNVTPPTTSSNTSVSSGTSSGSSSYTAYVPSARVKEISDAIAYFAGTGSSSSYTDSSSSDSSSDYSNSSSSSSSYSNTESSGSSESSGGSSSSSSGGSSSGSDSSSGATDSGTGTDSGSDSNSDSGSGSTDSGTTDNSSSGDDTSSESSN